MSSRGDRRERRSSLILTPTPERRSNPTPASRETTPTATASTPGDEPPQVFNRRSGRRSSARHRNYLNRSHLHNSVQLDSELPDGYGRIFFRNCYCYLDTMVTLWVGTGRILWYTFSMSRHAEGFCGQSEKLAGIYGWNHAWDVWEVVEW